MKKQIAEFELKDGTTHKVRLLLADKARSERTKRARGWKDGENDTAITTLMVWAAAVRGGNYVGDFETFFGTPDEPGDCVDLFVEQVDPEDTTDDDEHPTQRATPTH